MSLANRMIREILSAMRELVALTKEMRDAATTNVEEEEPPVVPEGNASAEEESA